MRSCNYYARRPELDPKGVAMYGEGDQAKYVDWCRVSQEQTENALEDLETASLTSICLSEVMHYAAAMMPRETKELLLHRRDMMLKNKSAKNYHNSKFFTRKSVKN